MCTYSIGSKNTTVTSGLEFPYWIPNLISYLTIVMVELTYCGLCRGLFRFRNANDEKVVLKASSCSSKLIKYHAKCIHRDMNTVFGLDIKTTIEEFKGNHSIVVLYNKYGINCFKCGK